jgi:hypothetical protein
MHKYCTNLLIKLHIYKIIPAVHERWYTTMMFIPVVISIRELRKNIIERLQTKHDEETFSKISIPGEEWIRLQFWPKTIYAKTFMQYTG